MDDLSRTIHDIETRGSAAATPDPTNSVGSDKARPESGEYVVDSYPYTEWHDDVFEETPRDRDTRLGEGAGGAVSEVTDKRTGLVMARKTIQTREAPMKQLLRELNLITTISHPNIIRFYGAYMSPSSSEVKVVMELCEGKSLEAVGRRIRERGARVGEKVAGRLAEGVRCCIHHHIPALIDLRFVCRCCKVSHTCVQRTSSIGTLNHLMYSCPGMV